MAEKFVPQLEILHNPNHRIVIAKDETGREIGSIDYYLIDDEAEKPVWEIDCLMAEHAEAKHLVRAFVNDVGSGTKFQATIINTRTVDDIIDVTGTTEKVSFTQEDLKRVPMLRGASILGLEVDELIINFSSAELFGHVK